MKSPTANSTGISTFDLPNGTSNAFDTLAFQDAIYAHGVEFRHERAMPDPGGLVDPSDIRRPGGPTPGGANGMVYTTAGCFRALFTGNSKELRSSEGGVIDAGTASLTPWTFYEGTENRVYLHPLDRLYLKEESVLVTVHQLVKTHESGVDRLNFPATEIQDVRDSNGVTWGPGTYKICGGHLEWTTGRPSAVYAVRYLYRPHWYVDRLQHQIRVVQGENPLTGERIMVRMPENAIIKREYIYLNQTPDTVTGKESPRDQPAPGDGTWGPR